MNIVSIQELEVNNKVVVQTDIDTVHIFTVKEVLIDSGLIIFKEMDPLDYAPEDPEQIVILD